MIRQDRDGALLTLTLDRPEKRNALTGAMLAELDAAVEEAAGAARALILTGTGSVFSAGADLDEARAGLATDPVWERLSGRIAGFPGLVIAALNGPCAGGAMGMALAADLRIGAPTAGFFYPVMRLGFRPQPSDPRRLAAIAGAGTARRVFLAGARLDAAEAHRTGLLDEIAPPEALLARARDLAADALSADPAHVAALKAMCAPG